MKKRPEEIREMFRKAMAKVSAEGYDPLPMPKGHPPNLDLILFSTNELSHPTKEMVEGHLKSCPVCATTLEKIKKRLLTAKTQEKAVEIMWELLELKR